ncbi:M14-type cytosolic carboxypeptidase [Tundrisphaera lichenicola]|uniref:M14-type cytosolic carboxypeptidase n=1 Tax=Tundrisphaera lichenicola TaxID=2029860 RepID=UPI003EB74F5D
MISHSGKYLWLAAIALWFASPCLADIRFNTNFEGGSLGTIETLGEGSYRCHVRGQQNESGRNRQASWYFFRMDEVGGRDLTITLTDFVGEYNGKPGAVPMGPGIVPVFSEDGEHWKGVPEVSWDDQAKEATIKLRPGGNSVWIAHQVPYTAARLNRLLDELGRSKDARVEVIGKSARGRDLHLVTVTDPDKPDPGKATVWLQARQHAWESGTSFVMEGALRFVTSDEPAARSLRGRVIFKFTPMVDPDGSAEGQVRFNANGFDVNRHWDEVTLARKEDLARMPEIWYVKKAILGHLDSGKKIDLMLNLHNTETAEYIETMASDETSRAIVGRLSDRLVGETTFRPTRGPTLGAEGGGTANVLHSETGLLILLMEQRIAKDPETGRSPMPEDRLAFGAKLIAIIAGTILP